MKDGCRTCDYCEKEVPLRTKNAMEKHLKRCPEYIKVLVTLKWLTAFEAQIYSRMSYNTLQKRRADGDIYGTVKGGVLRFERESIDRYFNRDRDELRLAMHGRRAS